MVIHIIAVCCAMQEIIRYKETHEAINVAYKAKVSEMNDD